MRLRVRCKAYPRKARPTLKRAKKSVAKPIRWSTRTEYTYKYGLRRTNRRTVYPYFGNSRYNTRCTSVSRNMVYSCPTYCYRHRCRVNRDFWNAGDRFRISWRKGRLCARRLDSRGGWGMRLKIRCTAYTLSRRIVGRVAKRVQTRVVKIRNPVSKKDLDVWRGRIANGQQEVIWYPHNGSNQKFRVVRLPYGRFQLESYNNRNLVVGQAGGYRVRLVKKNPRDAGQVLRYYGARKAIINNRGRCLDVMGASKRAGAGLYFWGCHYRKNQQFQLINQ